MLVAVVVIVSVAVSVAVVAGSDMLQLELMIVEEATRRIGRPEQRQQQQQQPPVRVLVVALVLHVRGVPAEPFLFEAVLLIDGGAKAEEKLMQRVAMNTNDIHTVILMLSVRYVRRLLWCLCSLPAVP